MVFSGKDRVHAPKFQSVMCPDGIMAHFWGPFSGRRHDSAMLRASRLMPLLEQHFVVNGITYSLFGDVAYPLGRFMYRGFKGGNLTPQQVHACHFPPNQCNNP